MATFRKRGKRWEAQVRKQGHDPKTKTFTLKADAEAWARIIESEMERGTYIDQSASQQTSFADCLERYGKEVSVTKKGATQEYSIIRQWLSLPITKKSIGSIKSKDLSKQRDTWLSSGLSAATVTLRLALISHLFNIARKEWGFEGLENPIENVRKPTVNNARTRRVANLEDIQDLENGNRNASDNELSLIIEETDSPYLPNLVILAVETAARRGELVSAKWENVNLERKFILFQDTKNGDSRTVPLSSRARAVFETLKQASKATQGIIFPITADAVSRRFSIARVRAREKYEKDCITQGIQPHPAFLMNLHFHDLRHEATSRLAKVYQVHELAKVTGHKDLKMVMRYYNPTIEELGSKLD